MTKLAEGCSSSGALVTCGPCSSWTGAGGSVAGRGGGGGGGTSGGCRGAAASSGRDGRLLFEQVVGPMGDEGMPGVFCCGLRVVSMDGWTSDVPDSAPNDEHFGRPSIRRDGASRRCGGWRRRSAGPGACWAMLGAYRDRSRLWRASCWSRAASARGCWCWRSASSCAGRWGGSSWPPGRDHVARRGVFHSRAGESAGRGTYLVELSRPARKTARR